METDKCFVKKDGFIIMDKVKKLIEQPVTQEFSFFYKKLRKDQVRLLQVKCNYCEVVVGLRIKSGTINALNLIGKDCID